MGQGSKRGLRSSRCPVPGICSQSGAGVDVETHMDVPLIPPWLSPTKDETQQQSCQGNNIEKRQFKERELYFFLLMFLFKTMHSTSIGLFCSVIYRGAAARWSVYKRQMQLGTGNNWEPYVWSDAELTEVGSRKPVAFHALWIRSTARTHLSTGRWDLPFTHRQWHLTKPTGAACSTSSMQPVLRETQDLLSWKEPIRNIESSSHPCIGQPQNSTHVSKGIVQLLLEQSCCRNTIRGFYLRPALQQKCT